MRLPDRNGVQSGSIKAPVLRGDGGTLAVGTVQKSGVPNVKFWINSRRGSTTIGAITDADGIVAKLTAAGSDPATQYAPITTGSGTPTTDRVDVDLSRGSVVFQDGLTEARMNAVVGCYVIRFAGHAQNAGELDALTLATRIESVNSDLQAKNIATNSRIGYALLSVSNPALGSRTVIANPFGNSVPVECEAEFFHATLQKWSTAPWQWTGASGIYGMTAAYSEGEGIVLRIAANAYCDRAVTMGSSQELTAIYTTPSPIRIHVRKVTA